MMIEIYLLLGLILAALLFFSVSYLRRRKKDALRKQVAQTALDGCNELLELARALQQHRGLSSGWLAGERSFEPRMQERRREIQRSLANLYEVAEMETTMPRPCFTQQNLALFRFQWRELIDELPTLSIEQSIARHTLMISRILDWLSALGEARVRLAMPDRVSAGLASNYADRLPMLAEYLGQLRALGSGVTARQQCSPVSRVRLRYLTTRGEMLLKEAHAAFRDAQSDSAAQAVDDLLTVIRQELIEGPIQTTTDSYFQTATRAIDSVYAWISECGSAVRDELANDEPISPPVQTQQAPL